MASSSNKALHSVELSAVSYTPHEHVEFNWTVQNFKALLDRAIYGDDDDDISAVASLPFNVRETLFPPGTPEVTLAWVIEVHPKYFDDDDDNNNNNVDDGEKPEKVKVKEIRVYLQKVQPSSRLSTNLYVECSVSVSKDKEFTTLEGGYTSVGLCQNSGPLYFLGYYWGCDLFDLSQVNEYLDSEGSLNIQVMTDLYVHSEDIAEILPQDSNNVQSEHKSNKMRKDILLDRVASLLGDELTSDVLVSVRTTDANVEIGKFLCHSAILSGRSSVLKEMLEGSTEKRDDKVVLKLEVEDVALLEVLDIFLTFLYSGKLKDIRKHCRSVDPTWVEMTPKLIDLAHKFKMNDLMDLCDVHLHRVVKRDNVLDILALANRHDLKRTLAKLQTKFSKDADVLLHSVYR